MKPHIFALWAFAIVGSTCCRAAIVPLSGGPVRIALVDVTSISGSENAGSALANATLVDIFYAEASQGEAQLTAGMQVWVYNNFGQQVGTGIIVPRPDTHDERNQLGIFGKSPLPSSYFESFLSLLTSAAPATGGSAPQSPLIAAGPYAISATPLAATVPEPGSLMIWSSLIASIGVLSALVRRRLRR